MWDQPYETGEQMQILCYKNWYQLWKGKGKRQTECRWEREHTYPSLWSLWHFEKRFKLWLCNSLESGNGCLLQLALEIRMQSSLLLLSLTDIKNPRYLKINSTSSPKLFRPFSRIQDRIQGPPPLLQWCSIMQCCWNILSTYAPFIKERVKSRWK